MNAKLPVAAVSILLFFLQTVMACAQTNLITFTNRTGEVIRDAKVLTFNAVDVFYEVPGGGTRVHLADLPPDLRRRFGYRPPVVVAVTNHQQSVQIQHDPDADVDAFLAAHSASTIDETWSTKIDRDRDAFWSLRVATTAFTLIKSEGLYNGPEIIYKMEFPYSDETIVRSNFDKFFKWDAIAESKNAEPFIKTMAEWPDFQHTNQLRKFKFDWMTHVPFEGGLSGIMEYREGDILGDEFTKADIDHFRSLIQDLQWSKRQLADKIRHTAQQDALFK